MKLASLSKSLILIAIIAAASIPSFAATTGTLSLSDALASNTLIIVTPAAAASTLPFGTATTALQIAMVVELTNDFSGYTVRLASGASATSGSSGTGNPKRYSIILTTKPFTNNPTVGSCSDTTTVTLSSP